MSAPPGSFLLRHDATTTQSENREILWWNEQKREETGIYEMKNEERRIMQEIQFIVPAALHDEMLRLRNEKQMDFLESLTGMDWGVADEKDAPEKLRGLGVVYHIYLKSSETIYCISWFSE